MIPGKFWTLLTLLIGSPMPMIPTIAGKLFCNNIFNMFNMWSLPLVLHSSGNGTPFAPGFTVYRGNMLTAIQTHYIILCHEHGLYILEAHQLTPTRDRRHETMSTLLNMNVYNKHATPDCQRIRLFSNRSHSN